MCDMEEAWSEWSEPRLADWLEDKRKAWAEADQMALQDIIDAEREKLDLDVEDPQVALEQFGEYEEYLREKNDENADERFNDDIVAELEDFEGELREKFEAEVWPAMLEKYGDG